MFYVCLTVDSLMFRVICPIFDLRMVIFLRNAQAFEELLMTFNRNLEILYGLNCAKVSIYPEKNKWVMKKDGDLFHFRIEGDSLKHIMEQALPVLKENILLLETKMSVKNVPN